MYRKKSRLSAIVCLFINFIAIFMSLSLAALLRAGFGLGWVSRDSAFKAYVALVLIWGFLFFFTDFFHRFFKRGMFEELMDSLKLNIYVFFLFLAVWYFFELEQISRLVLLAFVPFNVFLIWLINILYKKFLLCFIKQRKNTNRCVLLVNEDKLHEVLTIILNSGDFNHTLTGYVVYDKDCTGSYVKGVPCVAPGGGLIEYCRTHVVDEVFIYMNDLKEEHISLIIEELGLMGINTFLNLKEFDWDIPSKRVVEKFGFYTVMVFSNNIITWNQYILKRAFDICGAVVGMVFCVLIGIFAAPAIVIEDGFPFIYKQQRVGRNGRVFDFYKFRSMYRDAEERKKELMAQNEMNGPMFKMENDPRVTKVGKFIRKTSLDEFPQFFNVLKGDMSLVGTRPPTVDEYEQYTPYQKKRLSFRPGITGNWQVSGRSDIQNFEEVVRLDVEYIENWSFKKDIHILLKTIKNVLLGKGAK